MPLDKQEPRQRDREMAGQYSRFGLFIRQRREEYNLLQEEVANYCLVSRTQIANLEKGRFAPSMDLLFRLAEAFGYGDRIGDFLTDAGYTAKHPNE